MRVIELHLWVQNKDRTWSTDTGRKKPTPGKRIVIDPPGSGSIVEMKIAVAKELQKLANKLEYYYVVVVVERNDGTPGYRTIVPKTVVVT